MTAWLSNPNSVEGHLYSYTTGKKAFVLLNQNYLTRNKMLKQVSRSCFRCCSEASQVWLPGSSLDSVPGFLLYQRLDNTLPCAASLKTHKGGIARSWESCSTETPWFWEVQLCNKTWVPWGTTRAGEKMGTGILLDRVSLSVAIGPAAMESFRADCRSIWLGWGRAYKRRLTHSRPKFLAAKMSQTGGA